ncbi:MAG: FG-GAP-like repeat-containing protein [Tannerellaceae bacterium]|jgi:uncharacterized repeat protein (TIGR01451 family)|nr:FG-GAP-like repeat-containing protein [Tannerellaceae bacterium]
MKQSPNRPGIIQRGWISFLLTFVSCATAFAQNNLLTGTQDCASTRPPFSFSIDTAWTKPGVASPVMTPLVGDIDGDGKTEILVINPNKRGINVLDGPTGTLKGAIDVGSTLESEYPTCFLIVDGDSDGKAEVFIAGTTTQKAYLYEVTSAPGAATITFANVWEKTFSQTANGVTPIVADLDGDGSVEFVAGKYIYDYAGNLKATLPYSSLLSWTICIAYAADVDDDGLPEVISGSDVYNYNNGTLTLYARCPSFTNGAEGWNMSGDINMDGKIDLVFCSPRGTYTIWTPSTSTVMGTISVPAGQSSYPFIGDIDGTVNAATGKKHPEICFITSSTNYLHAYSYTGTGIAATNFEEKWKMGHSDTSGATAVTLFDFNLDGVVELIYRDETLLRVFNGSGSAPALLYSQSCTSGTTTETPVVADVTGDGSADIIVTGNGSNGNSAVFVFEGDASKWASAPSVWNQQMYSPLFVNLDLTIPTQIESQTLAFTQTCGTPETVYFYNGGPMQAPYISDATYCPIDVSPDVYVVSGTITYNSPTSITLNVTFGNTGLAVAPSTTPIRYYRNAIAAGNILGNETLGVDLAPGQTHVVSKTLTGLSPMPTQFYVRILDDGTNFPASGSYSDCNLTNNTKSFGTMELHKTVNATQSCIDGTSIFTVELINNSDQTTSPQTFNNIVLTDSLGSGWEYISSNALQGSLGLYDPATSKLSWTLPSLAPGDVAQMIIVAKSISAGAIRNYVWIEAVDGATLGREVIEAYVSVNATQAPTAPAITPANPLICESVGSVTLSGETPGAVSYQWYRNNVEITGATQSSYNATSSGAYTVSYYNGTCVSLMSLPATVTVSPCVIPVNPHLRSPVGN